ncbi:MAG: PAS domain S-box protein [Deltaproteobacteria bacterium]|nr:MAG: PAS domain S-box protein [Deltaproteobacteria bacterium]
MTVSDDNDRFRKMVEDSQDWFWEFDENANFTYASPRSRDLFGYEPEELVGLNAFDLMTPEEARRVHAHFDPIAEKYLPFKNLVNVNTHKDGRRVVVESSGTPIFDDAGRFRGYRGIDRDITGRARIEELLQENNDRLKTILETSTEWIWEVDLLGRHTYTNDRLIEFLGYAPEEVIGRDYSGFLHEDDQGDVAHRLAGYIREKRGWQGWTLRWRHKDGSYRWLESNARPICDAGGRVVGFRGADRDVTQRKLIEEQLRQSEEKFKEIATLLPQSIFEADFDGRLIFANRAAFELFGYSREDLERGVNVLQMIIPAEIESARDNIGKLYLGGEESSNEYTALRKDGSTFPVMIYSSVIRKGTVPVGLRGIIVDITKRKRYEQDIERARDAAERMSRAKDEFLANMSHELRTPIAAILGFSELLQGSVLSEQQQKYLGTIVSSSETLAALVDDLLDLARIEAGKMPLERKAFSLRKLIGEIADSQNPAAKAKHLAFATGVAAEVPDRLIGDPLRLKQVLLNLTVNAIKFSAAGEVSLAVAIADQHPSGPRLRFDVADTGIGIRAEDVAEIFQPFSQLDPSSTRKFGGAGLGLAICTKLLTLMGGEISVASRAGVGSTFQVLLPFEVAGVTPPEAGSSPAGPLDAPTGPPLRVLLVEDHEVNRDLFAEALSRCGHHVELAANGAEALAMLQCHSYDLVLMDVQMPVMDGLETIARIRAKEEAEGGHLPVIALTAHAREEDRTNMLGMGFDGYVSKPMKIKTLLDEVKRCLAPLP